MDRGRLVGGLVLLLLGVVFLIDKLFDIELLSTLWPLSLVALGAYLLLEGRRPRSNDHEKGGVP